MQFLIFWACDINCKSPLRLRANGRNIVGQQLPTLLDVTCCVCLHFLLHVVAQSLKPVKLFSQQLPTFLLFHDHYSISLGDKFFSGNNRHQGAKGTFLVPSYAWFLLRFNCQIDSGEIWSLGLACNWKFTPIFTKVDLSSNQWVICKFRLCLLPEAMW